MKWAVNLANEDKKDSGFCLFVMHVTRKSDNRIKFKGI